MLERLPVCQRLAIDLRLTRARAKNDVGVEPYHRIAAARGAAFDGFEQEHIAVAASRQFQEGRDGRLEIGDEARRDELCFARLVGAGKILEGYLDAHWSAPPVAARTAASLMRTP